VLVGVVLGEFGPVAPTLVRVHMQDTLGDLVDAVTAGHHWTLHQSLERIAQEGKGALVILRRNEPAEALVEQLKAYHVPKPEPKRPGKPDELRTYGIGAQIIADLGVQKMRVLSAPKIVHGIAGFGLEVVDYVS
jgi:3,4-dihydroxy 2-butanone 4-phosphate synthase/GTP cyclohydrolase II